MKVIRCLIHTQKFTGEHRVFFMERGKVRKKVRPDGPSVGTGYPSLSSVMRLSGVIPVYADEQLMWCDKVCSWQPEDFWVSRKGIDH